MVLIKFGLLPSIGVLLSFWLWTSLEEMAMTIGIVWLSLGTIYLLAITRMFTKEIPSLGDDEVKALIT